MFFFLERAKIFPNKKGKEKFRNKKRFFLNRPFMGLNTTPPPVTLGLEKARGVKEKNGVRFLLTKIGLKKKKFYPKERKKI